MQADRHALRLAAEEGSLQQDIRGHQSGEGFTNKENKMHLCMLDDVRAVLDLETLHHRDGRPRHRHRTRAQQGRHQGSLCRHYSGITKFFEFRCRKYKIPSIFSDLAGPPQLRHRECGEQRDRLGPHGGGGVGGEGGHGAHRILPHLRQGAQGGLLHPVLRVLHQVVQDHSKQDSPLKMNFKHRNLGFSQASLR